MMIITVVGMTIYFKRVKTGFDSTPGVTLKSSRGMISLHALLANEIRNKNSVLQS
jgi:hypothetical protein